MSPKTGTSDARQQRLTSYLDRLAEAAGHADRAAPLKSYCTGLLLPGGRKSVEPMAARLARENVRRMHQSLHHVVADAAWSDEALLRCTRDYALAAMTKTSPVVAWIIDDIGLPKKGTHSVGVARQYCGQTGKQDNCQVAVSPSVATWTASLPVAYRLYLPEIWANDSRLRQQAKVPNPIVFQTKLEIALGQIRQAIADEIAQGTVLADPAYGNDTGFRQAVAKMKSSYVLGIQSATTVWPPGTQPLPAPEYSGRGRPANRMRRDAEHAPVSAKQLALSLPAKAWKTVTWPEGTRHPLRSRFAAVRVRPAHRDHKLTPPRVPELDLGTGGYEFIALGEPCSVVPARICDRWRSTGMPSTERPLFSGTSRSRISRLLAALFGLTLLAQQVACAQASPHSGQAVVMQQMEDGMANAGPHKAEFDDQHRPITASGFVKTGPIIFMDVAKAAGLTSWYHISGTPEKRLILEAKGAGVCLLDYDNDGWLDIYVTNNGKNRLYHNYHDGTFTDVAETAGVTVGTWSTGATFGDYDGDGRLDLFVDGYARIDLSNPPISGSKAVGYSACQFRGVQVMCGPRGLKGEQDHLFHNNGDGTFTDVSKKLGVDDPSGYYGLGASFVDLNGDDKQDLLVANDTSPNYLYMNKGDGAFEEQGYMSGYALNKDGCEIANMGIAAGDYENNGMRLTNAPVRSSQSVMDLLHGRRVWSWSSST